MSIIWLSLLYLTAGKTGYFKLSDYKDYQGGEFNNTYLKQNAVLSLTPGCEQFCEVDELLIWCLYKDESGMYIGTGHQGKVYKADEKGNTTAILDLAAAEIIVIKKGPDDMLYFGSGPKGIIYKYNPDTEKKSIFCILPEQFIWDICFDKGYLYAATGGNGKIYKVSLINAEYETAFISTEENILGIKRRSGLIYASTSGQGFLYRIENLEKYKILYDAGGRDINDFIFMNRHIVLITSGKKIEQENSYQNGNNGNNKEHKIYKNQAVLIKPDGDFFTLFSVENQTFSALCAFSNNVVLAATAQNGAIYSINIMNMNVSKSFQLPGTSINSFFKGENIYFSSGVNSKIYKLSLEYAAEGSYITDILDAHQTALWGHVRYLNSSGNKKVSIYSRSGNSYFPEEDWGPWRMAENRKIMSANSRFIQVKFVLKAEQNRSPLLSDPAIYYARINNPPEVKEISIGRDMKFEKKYKIDLNQNELMVYWQAEDKDNDKLVYDLYYKNEFTREWDVVKKKLFNPYFVFNRYAVLEGEYIFAVEADDRLYNQTGENFSDRLTSKKFIIDNTAPDIVDFTQEKKNRISFNVRDERSVITICSISYTQSNFTALSPVDQVYDSTAENFAFDINIKVPYVVIFAEDSAGNFRYKPFVLNKQKE